MLNHLYNPAKTSQDLSDSAKGWLSAAWNSHSNGHICLPQALRESYIVHRHGQVSSPYNMSIFSTFFNCIRSFTLQTFHNFSLLDQLVGCFGGKQRCKSHLTSGPWALVLLLWCQKLRNLLREHRVIRLIVQGKQCRRLCNLMISTPASIDLRQVLCSGFLFGLITVAIRRYFGLFEVIQ